MTRYLDSDGLRRFAAGMKGRSESVTQIAISGDAAGASAAAVASLILAKLNGGGLSFAGLRPVAVNGTNGFGFGLAADWGTAGGKRIFMDYYSGGVATKMVFDGDASTKKWTVAFAEKK